MPHRKFGSNYSTKPKQFFLKCAALILYVFLLISSAVAERLPVKTYTIADGLQRDFVFRIRQDSRGFLWFCTAEGISRFDGFGMTNFTASDGLPDRVVEDFLETRNGTIYFATDKGLARLNPHGIRASTENPLFTVFVPDNPQAEKIQILYEDRNNQVWVGTSNGLYKLIETDNATKLEFVPLGRSLSSSGGAIFEPSPNTLSINSILEDRHGTLWIGSFGSGLFRISLDGTTRHFTTADGFGDNKITDLIETRDGRLWVSMRSDKSGGVCVLDEEATEKPIRKCYSVKDGLGSNWVRDMFETSDGQLWLATVPGLCHWQGENADGVCKTYSAENLCTDAFALAEDQDGNLWSGSACGAQKIARYGFTTYNTADGLNNNQITSIFENSSDEMFAVTFPNKQRDISRFDGNKFLSVKAPLPDFVNYYGWGWKQTVWQDSHGAWWIPTGYGLFRSPNGTSFENLARARLEKQETGAKAREIFRLFEDSRGDIWILTSGDASELLRWERARNVWHDYTSQVGFSTYCVGSALAEDSYGNVWIGVASDHGQSALIRFRDGQFRVLSQSAGAPGGWIRDLFLDRRGRLWIASTNDGVWRIDDTNSDNFEFVKYTTANGLTSIATASLTEDEFGRIYIGTWRGIDRLTPDTGNVENFTTDDGLPAGFVETAYRDRRNNLWFGTDRGLAKFVPEPLRTRKPPTLLITGLRVEGEPQRVSILGENAPAPLDLNSDRRQITVDFIGLGASLGEKLKYEYRLGKADWTATAERTLNFANLASGDYKLEIRAQTNDRIYSQTSVVSFKIAAPVWQRWWFILLTAFILCGLIYTIYKYRLQRLLELEKIRTRIATDLHDDIGANLTRISLLSEVARQKSKNGNGNLLTSIADIARESVASMNDIVWAIAPEHDNLFDLTRRMRQHAEEVFALRDIDLSFNVPSAETDLKLSVSVRRDLLLIFKEAVNNAAKHSLCTKVWIDFGLENSVLELRVKDNGKGFDETAETDGQGLRSLSRRAESLGGTLTIDSRPNKGTNIKFEMSVQKAGQV